MKVRALTSNDRKAWEALWQESVDGVLSQDVIDHSFANINDKNGSIKALLAESDSEGLVGLLHYVIHPVAGCIAPVCYMQDLFVSPKARRQGIARALMAELEKTATREKYDRIYWLLENSNEDAKAFYQDIGIQLNFGLYIIPVGMRDRLNLPEKQTA